MAARNPSSFTRYLKERIFVGGLAIVESEIDKAYNDQVYVLDAQQLAVSDCWYRCAITDNAAFGAAGSTATQLVRHWYITAKDMCDVAGVVTADGIAWAVYTYVMVTGGATAQIRGTTGASANNTQTGSTTSATFVWIQLDEINFRTNDTEETFILEGRISAGAGTLYVAGLGLYAKET